MLQVTATLSDGWARFNRRPCRHTGTLNSVCIGLRQIHNNIKWCKIIQDETRMRDCLVWVSSCGISNSIKWIRLRGHWLHILTICRYVRAQHWTKSLVYWPILVACVDTVVSRILDSFGLLRIADNKTNTRLVFQSMSQSIHSMYLNKMCRLVESLLKI